MNSARYCRSILIIFVIIASTLLAPTKTFGQDLPPPETPAQASPASSIQDGVKVSKDAATERDGSHNFFKNLLRDQKAFLKSPLSLERSDAKWLVPLAGATALLIVTDHRVSDRIGESKDLVRHSRTISTLGSPYATFGAAGTFYAIGALSKNERLRETGAMGLEALVDSAIVARGLKLATGRQRPGREKGEGGFWSRGDSFPSGHAITTWALASVVAHQYPDKPWVRVAAYGVAASVSIARVTGHSHYPSDVLIGGSLGFLIGQYVVRAHGKSDRRRVPSISPYFSQATKTYGVGLSLGF